MVLINVGPNLALSYSDTTFFPISDLMVLSGFGEFFTTYAKSSVGLKTALRHWLRLAAKVGDVGLVRRMLEDNDITKQLDERTIQEVMGIDQLWWFLFFVFATICMRTYVQHLLHSACSCLH